MKERILLAFIPYSLPTAFFIMLALTAVSGGANVFNIYVLIMMILSFLLGLIAAAFNPLTYIFSLLFGFISFKLKSKPLLRIIIQTLIIAIPLEYILWIDAKNGFGGDPFFFINALLVPLILALIHIGLEKLYEKWKSRRDRKKKS